MPVAFTPEELNSYRQKLQEAALRLVADTPVRKIRVEQLTQAAGISKGAFYKFYPSKELLFYNLLRQLHREIYAPALKILTDSAVQDPADALCSAIIRCYDALEKSPYKRFWLEDSTQIMKAIPEDEKQGQYETEAALFRSFLTRFGPLAVTEAAAFDAIRALVLTVYHRRCLEDNYEPILRWMAQGVCSHIFK